MEKIIKKADIYLKLSGSVDIRITVDVTTHGHDVKKILFDIAENLDFYLSEEMFDNDISIQSIYFREEKINAEN